MLSSINTLPASTQRLVAPRTEVNGQLKMVGPRDWTSGFFAGELWMLFKATGDGFWKSKADSFTRLLEEQQFNGTTHDLGFMIYCSYGNGYKLTNDAYFKDVIIQSAKTLTTRFNPTIGCIRSWDHGKDNWQFPVIIDNMMNLELLFAATKFTGDSMFYKIAVTHANTTLKNHFRNDYSSYHVVNYDTSTGKVVSRVTHQGFADESAWARGQAWGLYGYTMCYRETKDIRYLQRAEQIANFLLQHPNMPADKVPYWDCNDPKIPNVPRDASAAAIMSTALLELSQYSKEGKGYKSWAIKTLENLTNSYRAEASTHQGFILLHSTGHLPANSEIDVPINYADYYYLEALLRTKAIKK
jgi:rhamnogalacturonyl hydrolase YesR